MTRVWTGARVRRFSFGVTRMVVVVACMSFVFVLSHEPTGGQLRLPEKPIRTEQREGVCSMRCNRDCVPTFGFGGQDASMNGHDFKKRSHAGW